jgi:hypothetical protein
MAFNSTALMMANLSDMFPASATERRLIRLAVMAPRSPPRQRGFPYGHESNFSRFLLRNATRKRCRQPLHQPQPTRQPRRREALHAHRE